MVRLYAVALEDVGVDGALCEKLDVRQLARFLLEHADELGADDFALGFGVGHARQLGQEALRRVDVHQIRVHPIAEHLDHLLRLALAQQPVVDVYADELLPDGLDQQRRDDRRIDPAGQRQQHPFIAHLRADFPHLLVDELRRQRLRGDARHRLRPFVVLHRSTPYPFLYAYCSVFLFASQKPMRASMYASSASIGMRSCAIVSRSRTVTQPSVSLSKS